MTVGTLQYIRTKDSSLIITLSCLKADCWQYYKARRLTVVKPWLLMIAILSLLRDIKPSHTMFWQASTISYLLNANSYPRQF